jgi:geranylgeranyl diphosphate synthase type II
VAVGATEPHATYPEELRRRVERYLEGIRFSDESLTEGLQEAMRYSLLAPGKRIRPVLALATARAIGSDEEQMLPLAAALELIHTYSLIHDDLPAMDDDEMRRGRPTCHVAFGEDVAILAGDGLYAEAFRHVLERQRSAPDRVVAAVATLAAATGVGGMVGGQYLDVAGRAQCVLILVGARESDTMAFRRFAAELGVLFQIVDDILDVTGTDDALGKPSGSDERHGKRTYVSEYGLDGARDLAAESHTRALTALATAAPNGAPELERITSFVYTRTS